MHVFSPNCFNLKAFFSPERVLTQKHQDSNNEDKSHQAVYMRVRLQKRKQQHLQKVKIHREKSRSLALKSFKESQARESSATNELQNSRNRQPQMMLDRLASEMGVFTPSNSNRHPQSAKDPSNQFSMGIRNDSSNNVNFTDKITKLLMEQDD